MHEMPMPGGWTMSMMWLRMPGQSWPGALASFLGMWVVMTAAMMLPSLIPTLWKSRPFLGWSTAVVAAGHFLVWTLLGMIMYPVGVALVAIALRQPALARAVPVATGVVILIAGLVQRTGWKAHALTVCRDATRGLAQVDHLHSAWRHGLCLGLHCVQSCAALMAIALVMGAMNLRVMALVTAAISLERLAPSGVRIARAVGLVALVAGLFVIAVSRERASSRGQIHALGR